MKRALIIGISGQDGPYLARFLRDKGYQVFGASRNHQARSFDNLAAVGVDQDVELLSMSLMEQKSIHSALESVRPDEIYNLTGPSSVGRSFEFPLETRDAIVTGTHNLLESLRITGSPARAFSTASSECFGETPTPASETTPFNPVSPYAAAKSEAYSAVLACREKYDVFVCSGILFNHESPLRPVEFVSQKIINGAVSIANGRQKKLVLGNLDIIRDWGWAPEYVEAMWKILQADEPGDFVIATGQSHSLKAVVQTAFDLVGLDWQDHVETDQKFMRPADIHQSMANPEKAHHVLGWEAAMTMPEIVKHMIEQAQLTKDQAS